MTATLYPAARAVAPALHAHFARHQAAARRDGHQDLAPLAGADVIEAIVDAAFWASVRRQEGYVPRISLAFTPPAQAGRPLLFDTPLPLGPSALARLAPAVERPGIHLGVWGDPGALHVWGTTRTIPTLCFVLEVVAPGLLVVKHRLREELPKFVNVAVLEGEKVKVLSGEPADLARYPAVLTSLLGIDSPASVADRDGVLARLAVSMRAHGRGGSLLVVPAGSEAWRESIVPPLAYAVRPPFAELAELVRGAPEPRAERRWQDALGRAVEAIAGLTAVDGATLITGEYDLLAFGAKIRRREGRPEVEKVVVTEPIEGGTPAVVHPGQLGGTRHLSAAQFAHDQRDSLALVASQDGRFTLFAWSPREELVGARRLEALLL
jgi:sensor domain DACNV-containing protein